MTDLQPDSKSRIVSSDISWRLVLATLCLVCGFVVIDFWVLPVSNFAYRMPWYMRSNYRDAFAYLDCSFIGLFLAQPPILWLWLRRNVSSMRARIIMGVFVCHAIMLVTGAGHVIVSDIDWKATNQIGIATFLCMYYFVFGIALAVWCRLLGLKSIGRHEQASRQLSLFDLLVVTFVLAFLLLEISWLLEIDGKLFSVENALLFVNSFLSEVALAFVVALGVGSFWGASRSRFAFWFYLLVLLGPALVSQFMSWQLGRLSEEKWIQVHIACWSLALGIFLTFPLLSPRRDSLV